MCSHLCKNKITIKHSQNHVFLYIHKYMEKNPKDIHEFDNSGCKNWSENQRGFPYLYCLKSALEMYSCVVNNDQQKHPLKMN